MAAARRLWVWATRAVAVASAVAFIGFLIRTDLDKADKVSSVFGLILTIGGLLYAYLRQQPRDSTEQVFLENVVRVLLRRPGPGGLGPTLEESQNEQKAHFTAKARSEFQALTDAGVAKVPWTVLRVASEPSYRTAPFDEHSLAAYLADGGRLIIAGASQSGKTALAVRLMTLLGEQADRIPVLFRLFSYDPRVSLATWMMSVLRSDRDLQGPELEHARMLLDSGAIVPFFDGFDEIDPAVKERVSRALREYTRERAAVVTGIPQTGGQAFLDRALPDALMISLQPIQTVEIQRYLLANSDSADQEMWERLAASLEAPATEPLRDALSSPLNAWLVKSVYAYADPGTDIAAELLSASGPDIETSLLRRVVARLFHRNEIRALAGDEPPAGFREVDAESWLAFLAAGTQSRAIAFWQLRARAPLTGIAVGITALLAVGCGFLDRVLPASSALTLTALAAGTVLGFGFARGYSIGRSRQPEDPTRVGYHLPPDASHHRDPGTPRSGLSAPGGSGKPAPKDGSLRDHGRSLLKGLLLAVLFYAISLVMRLPGDDFADWRLGLTGAQAVAAGSIAFVLALVIGYPGGRVAAGIMRLQPKLESSTGARSVHPAQVVKSDRTSGIGLLVCAGLVMAVGYPVYDWLWDSPGDLRLLPLVTVVGALPAMFVWNQWAPYKVAQVWLALQGKVPMRLTSFLSESHRLGILRQNGNHYVFRHENLRRCLEEMYQERR